MLKSFRELREQSIHLSKKGRKTRHARAHELEPHTAHPYTTGPSNESYDMDELMELSMFAQNVRPDPLQQLARRRTRNTIQRKLWRGTRGVGSGRRRFHKLKTTPTRGGAPIQRESKEQINELLGALAGAAVGALAYRAVTRKGGMVDRVQKERLRKERLKNQIKNSEERTKALKAKLSGSSVFKAAVSNKFGNRPLEEDAPANVSGGNAPLGTSDSDKTAAALMSAMRAKIKRNMFRRKKPV